MNINEKMEQGMLKALHDAYWEMKKDNLPKNRRLIGVSDGEFCYSMEVKMFKDKLPS